MTFTLQPNSSLSLPLVGVTLFLSPPGRLKGTQTWDGSLAALSPPLLAQMTPSVRITWESGENWGAAAMFAHFQKKKKNVHFYYYHYWNMKVLICVYVKVHFASFLWWACKHRALHTRIKHFANANMSFWRAFTFEVVNRFVFCVTVGWEQIEHEALPCHSSRM